MAAIHSESTVLASTDMTPMCPLDASESVDCGADSTTAVAAPGLIQIYIACLVLLVTVTVFVVTTEARIRRLELVRDYSHLDAEGMAMEYRQLYKQLRDEMGEAVTRLATRLSGCEKGVVRSFNDHDHFLLDLEYIRQQMREDHQRVVDMIADRTAAGTQGARLMAHGEEGFTTPVRTAAVNKVIGRRLRPYDDSGSRNSPRSPKDAMEAHERSPWDLTRPVEAVWGRDGPETETARLSGRPEEFALLGPIKAMPHDGYNNEIYTHDQLMIASPPPVPLGWETRAVFYVYVRCQPDDRRPCEGCLCPNGACTGQGLHYFTGSEGLFLTQDLKSPVHSTNRNYRTNKNHSRLSVGGTKYQGLEGLAAKYGWTALGVYNGSYVVRGLRRGTGSTPYTVSARGRILEGLTWKGQVGTDASIFAGASRY